MEDKITDLFVPYALSLRLKEIGFNEACIGVYYKSLTKGGKWSQYSKKAGITNNESVTRNLKFECTSPTYDQVFKWFRKGNSRFKIDGRINYNDGNVFSITCYNKKNLLEFYESNVSFLSYEEAQHACIHHMILRYDKYYNEFLKSIKKKSVVGIITNERNQVLLLKRHSFDETLPNFYCLAGGKVDGRESLEDALKREIWEETGIRIDNYQYFGTGENKKFVINFYKVKIINKQVFIGDEHDSYIWMDMSDLHKHKNFIAPVTFQFLKKL